MFIRASQAIYDTGHVKIGPHSRTGPNKVNVREWAARSHMNGKTILGPRIGIRPGTIQLGQYPGRCKALARSSGDRIGAGN